MNKTELIDALADAKLLNQAYHKPNLTFRNEQATIDEKKTGVWIALAGSNDLKDWWQNYTMFRRPWWQKVVPKRTPLKVIPGTNWKATAGYVDAAETACKMIRSQISKTQPLFFSGHSKGGPVIAISAIILATEDFNVQRVRTFAAPRFSKKPIPADCLKNIKQYATTEDVVPRLPCRWADQSKLLMLGDPDIDKLGVIRDAWDAVEAHLIEAYIEELEKEIKK